MAPERIGSSTLGTVAGPHDPAEDRCDVRVCGSVDPVHPPGRDQWRATTSGGPGWPARQPDRQPGRGALRRRGVALARAPPAGPAARAARAGGPGRRGDDRSQARNRQLALERLAAQSTAGLRSSAARRPTRRPRAPRGAGWRQKRRRRPTSGHRRRPGTTTEPLSGRRRSRASARSNPAVELRRAGRGLVGPWTPQGA